MQAREIVCIRTTGEKVYLIAETDRNTWKVRRPVISEHGEIRHETEEFFSSELATVVEYAQSMVQEMILKAKCQKELMKTELSLTNEVEAEVARAIDDDREDKIN